MFKQFALATTLILFSLITAAQITIERNWKKGDMIEVNASQTQMDDGEESLSMDDMDMTVFTVEVIDNTKDFFLVQLTRDNLLEEMAEQMNEGTELAEAIDFDKLRYECRFYKNDDRFEVTNAGEIQSFMEGTFDSIMKVFEQESESEGGEAGMAFVRMLFEGILEPYKDEQMITEMVAQELNFLIDPYIADISSEKTNRSITCPNPFKPGDTIDAKRSTWMENYDKKAASCEVVSDIQMDMSSMIAQMLTMVEDMAKMFKEEGEEWTEEDEQKLEEQRAEIRAMEMDATISERVTMNLDSTWPERIEQTMFLNGSDHTGPRRTEIKTVIDIKKVK